MHHVDSTKTIEAANLKIYPRMERDDVIGNVTSCFLSASKLSWRHFAYGPTIWDTILYCLLLGTHSLYDLKVCQMTFAMTTPSAVKSAEWSQTHEEIVIEFDYGNKSVMIYFAHLFYVYSSWSRHILGRTGQGMQCNYFALLPIDKVRRP